jgi:hypothetical protein
MQAMSWSRLRWRMRGAWLWPAFLVGTVAGGVILDLLPPGGETGTGVVAGMLIAGFLNLAALIVVGGAGGLLLRRRRPDLPREIARDYAGTVGVGLVSVVLLVAGLAHRSAIEESERDFAAQQASARDFIAHNGPADARANATATDTIKIDDDMYRTCAPVAQQDRAFCVYVDTSQSPPGIKVDRNRATNQVFAPLTP